MNPEDQFKKRTEELLKEEENNPPQWWYMSFAETGRGFLGGVIVRAKGPVHARFMLPVFGITSPGGDVIFFPLPDEDVPPAKYRNCLLTKEQLKEFWPDLISLREFEEEQNKKD
jgi:hypothetical protein